MTKSASYTINGVVYHQRPLVLGQIRQLSELFKGLEISVDMDVSNLISYLGDNLPKALAIVLTEEGKSPKDKDLDELASELEFNMSPEQVMEVIENFFDINPIASLMQKLAGTTENIKAKIDQQKTQLQS